MLNALRAEVAAIMEPIGLVFQWRNLAGPRKSEVSAELAVISFQGRCDIAGIAGRSKYAGALGWTHVSDGEILPFTDVACDRVRDFLQRELLSLDADGREQAYGRALGRVLAHELYHIFANTTRHAAWGVAKECYTVQDLMSDDFQFRDKESRLLRSARPQVIPAVAGDTR